MGHAGKLKIIARDAVILFLALAIANAVGGALVHPLANPARARHLLITLNALLGIFGFALSGYLSPRRRWVHLVCVAISVWLLAGIILKQASDQVSDVASQGVPLRVWALVGVYLLLAMAIGGVISSAMRKDPGGGGTHGLVAPLSGRARWAFASLRQIRIAVVLSSPLFLCASCYGIVLTSIPVMEHMGANDMSRGAAPDPFMMVMVSVASPSAPGTRQIEAVMLGNLPHFQMAHPDYSFLIPAGSGRFNRNGTSGSYQATAVGPDEVSVETRMRSDDPFGLGVIASYEATERDVQPIRTSRSSLFIAGFFGLLGASVLGVVGSILKKELWTADYQGHHIQVTNSWLRGAKIYIDGALRAESKSLFANPRKPAFCVTLDDEHADPVVEVFFRAVLSVKAKIIINGQKVAGDLA